MFFWLGVLLGDGDPAHRISRQTQWRAFAFAAQQPLQIFLSLAFIMASSALMVSTYFPVSLLEDGAETDAKGLAATAGFAAGAALS
jgi:hypothetical protein